MSIDWETELRKRLAEIKRGDAPTFAQVNPDGREAARKRLAEFDRQRRVKSQNRGERPETASTE